MQFLPKPSAEHLLPTVAPCSTQSSPRKLGVADTILGIPSEYLIEATTPYSTFRCASILLDFIKSNLTPSWTNELLWGISVQQGLIPVSTPVDAAGLAQLQSEQMGVINTYYHTKLLQLLRDILTTVQPLGSKWYIQKRNLCGSSMHALGRLCNELSSHPRDPSRWLNIDGALEAAHGSLLLDVWEGTSHPELYSQTTQTEELFNINPQVLLDIKTHTILNNMLLAIIFSELCGSLKTLANSFRKTAFFISF